MQDLTDSQLMMRVRSGDHEAFATLVDRYRNSLVNYLTHLDGSRDRAEEFAQEAFLRLYQHADRYDEQGRLAPYLFRIATNLFRSEKRRERRWELLWPRFSSNGDRHHEPMAQAGLMRDEIRRKVSEAVASLPLRLRAPIVMREIEGWSYREIAETLECEEGTIKSRIFRGREQLKRVLAPYWNGGVDERPATERAVSVTSTAR